MSYLNTMWSKWIFGVSLLVIKEGMIPEDPVHDATVWASGDLKLKRVHGSINVQSLHVVFHFSEIYGTGAFWRFFP